MFLIITITKLTILVSSQSKSIKNVIPLIKFQKYKTLNFPVEGIVDNKYI